MSFTSNPISPHTTCHEHARPSTRAQNGPEFGSQVCNSAHWSFSGAVVFPACQQLLHRRALLSNEVALQGRVMDILACVLRPDTDTSVASLVKPTDWVLVDRPGRAGRGFSRPMVVRVQRASADASTGLNLEAWSYVLCSMRKKPMSPHSVVTESLICGRRASIYLCCH